MQDATSQSMHVKTIRSSTTLGLSFYKRKDKKMKKKTCTLLVILLFLIAPNIVVGQVNATPVNNNVIINGFPFTASSPILNIEGSNMVPFREFAEAMGATVGWYQSAQRISLVRGNVYSILHIGGSFIQHGQLSGTPIIIDGNIVGATFLTQYSTIMDLPAKLISVNGQDLTYIPLRAVAESLGATVDWNANTSTATINILQQGTTLSEQLSQGTQTSSETEESEDDLPANFGDFSNISHFRDISSMQAQARFNDSNEFPLILVVYDSEDFYSRLIVPDIQDISQRVGYTIFGLNLNSNNNVPSENSWIWSFVRENTFEVPSILYIYNRNNVNVVMRQSINLQNLDVNIRNFRTISQTGIAAGDFRSTNWFNNVNSVNIRDMYQNGEEFIFLLYDSQNQNSYHYVPIVVAAAREVNHRIFAVDINRNPQFLNHLQFAPSIGNNLSHRMPMLFLIYNQNNNNNSVVYDRPYNVSATMGLLNEFRNNSLFYVGPNNNQLNQNNQPNQFRDLNDPNRFINSSSRTIQNMVANNQNFIVLVYDSNVTNTAHLAYSIRQAALLFSEAIFAVDLNSNIHSNRVSNDLSWLMIARGTNDISVTYPVMIHFATTIGSPSSHVARTPMTFSSHTSDSARNAAFNFIQSIR